MESLIEIKYEMKNFAKEIMQEIQDIESPLALFTAQDIAKRYVQLSSSLVKELWNRNLIPFIYKKSIRVSFKKDVESYLKKLEVSNYSDSVFSKKHIVAGIDRTYENDPLYISAAEKCDKAFAKKSKK